MRSPDRRHQIIYGALCAMAQEDFKKLVA